MLRLFLQNPDVLADYQRRFRYTLVDEYQDTNVAQYLWLRLIAGGSPNICCVGDDDQSIYGWRGAEVDNILRFETDFPGAKVIRLERNYRSKGHILAAASGLIAHNKGRLGKTLFTDDAMGLPVVVTGVWDDEEEARTIGEDIEALKKAGTRLNDMAILVRASFQMRAFEDRFVTLGLPYRVIGGPRFYERQEIKDAIAYLEVTLNPTNDLKFERIVNVPKRGLGDTAVRRVSELARARSVPLYQAAREIVETEELTGRARKALADLVAAFERWRGADRRHEAHRARRADPGRDRLHADVAERQEPAGAFAAGEPERADPLHARVREPAGLPGARLARHGRRQAGRRRPHLADDAARRQGPGVRRGVPARAGRRGCSRTSAASTRTARRASRRSAGWPTSASRARAGRPRSASRRTGATAACGRRRRPRASSTSCPRPTWR